MRSFLLLTCGLFLAACEEEEENSRTTGISIGEEPDPIVPRPGQWYYDVWQWTAHECGVSDEDLPIDNANGFKIPQSSTKRFDLQLEQDVSMTCKITGDDFLCGAVATSSSYSDGLIELDVELITEGHFPQESFMIGHHQLFLDCEGQGCAAVESYYDLVFPCQAGIDFNAFHE